MLVPHTHMFILRLLTFDIDALVNTKKQFSPDVCLVKTVFNVADGGHFEHI